MPTDIKGKKIAIAGRFACVTNTKLQLLIRGRSATIIDSLTGLDIVLVGQGGAGSHLVSHVHRRNALLSLGPSPKLIDLWNERRVAAEFGEGTTSLSGRTVRVAGAGVAHSMLCRLIESRGGTIVDSSQPCQVLITHEDPGCPVSGHEVWGPDRLVKEFGPDAPGVY